MTVLRYYMLKTGRENSHTNMTLATILAVFHRLILRVFCKRTIKSNNNDTAGGTYVKSDHGASWR